MKWLWVAVLLSTGCGSILRPDIASLTPAIDAPGISVVQLGTFEIGDDGTTQELSLEYPPDVSAVYIGVIGSDPEASVVLVDARTPRGHRVVGDVRDSAIVRDTLDRYFGGFSAEVRSSNHVVAHVGEGAFMLPNTPAIPIESGRWTFRVGQYETPIEEGQFVRTPARGSVRVFAVVRRGPAPTRGEIDLALVFAPSSGITAEQAPRHPVIEDILFTVNEVYSRVGISIGHVRYLDYDGPEHSPMPARDMSCMPSREMRDVFIHAHAPAGHLPIVFLSRLACDRGNADPMRDSGGMSNGIPGFPLARGDGLLVTTNRMDEYPTEYGYVVAHEIGHFLGLFHTVELEAAERHDILVVDNVPDTIVDENADRNVMYGGLSTGRPTFTPQQGELLRRSPWVRATAR